MARLATGRAHDEFGWQHDALCAGAVFVGWGGLQPVDQCCGSQVPQLLDRLVHSGEGRFGGRRQRDIVETDQGLSLIHI